MSAAPIVPTDLSRIPDALKETPHWDLYQLVQGEDKPVMLPCQSKVESSGSEQSRKFRF